VTATAATAKAASTKAATRTAAATRKAATAARTAAATKRAAAKPVAAEVPAAEVPAAKTPATKPAAVRPPVATAVQPVVADVATVKPTAAKASSPAVETSSPQPAASIVPSAVTPVVVRQPLTVKAPPVGSRGRHRAETPASAKIAAARAVVAKTIAAKAAAPAPPAPQRPTPFRRTPVTAAVAAAPVAGAATQPSADPAGVVAAVARGGRDLPARRPPSNRRRPSLYLAAALVGALSISGAAAGQPTEVETTTVSQSVSVAEQLGLEAAPPELAVANAEATSRLQGLVSSRNVRDAERTAAADAQAEADRLAVEAAIEAARPKVVLPVEGARLTSGFGARWGTLHAGIDLAAPMRTPEYAVMDGVVLEAGPASGFGLAVYIQHDNGDVTVYGHMDEILVQAGQVVRAGDTIALLGNRGQSTGPHLHFEVHVGGLGGKKIDPLPWLRERGVQI
jgi:murein DD-endopeptidase MepM/ murein hydrolase activator NlpD